MFSVFDEVIESAVGIEVHNRNSFYKSDPTLKNVYVMFSAFEDRNNIIPVKLEIKEFNDKPNTLYVAISLEAIKKAEVSEQGTTGNGVAQNSLSATYSITDLFSKINPKDIDFIKYLPDELLNDKQLEAKKKHADKEYLKGIEKGISSEVDTNQYDTERGNLVTDRMLLANALESTAKTPKELMNLRAYKEGLQRLNEEAEKLAELNRKIKEISFTKTQSRQ